MPHEITVDEINADLKAGGYTHTAQGGRSSGHAVIHIEGSPSPGFAMDLVDDITEYLRERGYRTITGNRARYRASVLVDLNPRKHREFMQRREEEAAQKARLRWGL